MKGEPKPKVGFLGAGAFGLPSLEALRARFDVPFVVSQLDRPAGRGRSSTPTPISQALIDRPGPALLRTMSINTPQIEEAIAAFKPDALVVIAFGQKIGPRLLADTFAVNLHASLLPRWRGAAPINRAMIAGDERTGVSVISLAERMDAGEVHALRATEIDPGETAGELHDRLATLGVEPLLEVVERYCRGGVIESTPQDETLVTAAPKLSREEGTVDFQQPAAAVRARIHGLSPWPGCDVLAGGKRLRLKRAGSEACSSDAAAGTLLGGGLVVCGEGGVRLLEVQPPGKATMTWDAFQHGRAIELGTVFTPIEAASG